MVDGGTVLILGPAWNCGCVPADGRTVEVEHAPEGPQRADLAPDVAAALEHLRTLTDATATNRVASEGQ